MSRLEAYKQNKLWHTYEMVDWLQTTAGVPEDLSTALLGAWIGILRHDALLHMEKHHEFLAQLHYGKGRLCLNAELAPCGWSPWDSLGWSNETFWAQMTQATGVDVCDVRHVLHLMHTKLASLAGEKAFEPLGWVTRGEGAMLIIHCWPDFLQPLADDPQAVLLGVA